MKRLSKILVILDGKRDKPIALERAAALASQCEARVQLFTANYHDIVEVAILFEKEYMEGVKRDFVRQQKEWLDAIATPLRAKGVEVDVDAAWSRPVERAILDKIESYQPDLVLLEGQHHGRFQRMFSSQLDWQLLKKSPVPVLLLNFEEWDSDAEIIVCVDPIGNGEDSGIDDRVLQQAKTLANVLGNPLTLFHAYHAYIPSMAFDFEGISEQLDAHVEKSKQAIQKLVQTHQLDPGQLETYQGDLISGLLEYRKKKHFQMVILGARHHSALSRWLLGTTGQKIVDHVPTDVLVVKQ